MSGEETLEEFRPAKFSEFVDVLIPITGHWSVIGAPEFTVGTVFYRNRQQ